MSSYATMSAEDLFDEYRHKDDAQAFSFLITKHEFKRTVAAYIGQTGIARKEDKEDLLQELLIHMTENRADYDRKQSKLTTWIYRKIRWMRADHFKQHSRTGKPEKPSALAEKEPAAADNPELLSLNDNSFDQASLDPHPEKQLIMRAMCNILFEVIRSLDDESKTLFFHRFCLGTDFAALAEQTGGNASTLRTNYHRTTETVRAELIRRGFDMDALALLADDQEMFVARSEDLDKLEDETTRTLCRGFLFEGGSPAKLAKNHGLRVRDVRGKINDGLAELLRQICRAPKPVHAPAALSDEEFDRFTDRVLLLGLRAPTRAGAGVPAHPDLTTLKLLFRALNGGTEALKLSLGAFLSARQEALVLSLDNIRQQLALTPPQVTLLLTDALPAAAFSKTLQERLRAVFAIASEELAALLAVTGELATVTATTRGGEDINFEKVWQRTAAARK